MKIARIIGREIYDSRGWPTVQCELILENGQSVFSCVPSGLSKGVFEALELRDGDTRLLGKGVLKAIENIEQVISPQFIGLEPQAIDMDLKMIEIDGTADKSRLGANAMLAVSMALYRAQALVEGVKLYEIIAYLMGQTTVSLPFPLLNVINGGVHSTNNLRIQEFMIVPVGAPNFRAAFEIAILVFHELESMLKNKYKIVGIGDEGGFTCDFSNDIEALDILFEAIEKVNSRHHLSCIMAIDVAASQFYDPVKKIYNWHAKQFTAQEMIEFYQDLTKKYPIYAIEDGLSEYDWENWAILTKLFENQAQIIADDLFATNILRVAQGIDDSVANGVIIKPNQAGTITECLQVIKLCKSHNISTIISHRSGETEDTFISDLAVGSSAGQIKAGGCCRSDRIAKYNRLLTIEDELALTLFNA